MNRREFLKGLLTAGVLVAANPKIALEQFLVETVNMTDSQFVTYVIYTAQIYVVTPAQCRYIDNIVIPEEY